MTEGTAPDTEVELLKVLAEDYGLTVSTEGDTEVPLLKQIAEQLGISVATEGDTEVPLLKQIADYYGISATDVGDTEVPILKQIVLALPSTTYTTATIGDTEVPILKQWVASNPSATQYITPDFAWLTPTGISSTGGLIDSWAPSPGTGTLTQTGTARPTLTSSVFGTSSGATFDGSNDYLTSSAKLTAANLGTIGMVFKTGTSVAGPMTLLAQANTATATDYWRLGIAADGRLFIETNGTATIKGSTILEPSTVYYLMLAHDANHDLYLELNGVEENPLVNTTGVELVDWIGDVDGGSVRLTLGACVTSGGASQFFNGSIGGVWIWNSDITA